MVITNCEKKERDLIETDGNILYITELIDDEALFDIFWIYIIEYKDRQLSKIETIFFFSIIITAFEGCLKLFKDY